MAERLAKTELPRLNCCGLNSAEARVELNYRVSRGALFIAGQGWSFHWPITEQQRLTRLWELISQQPLKISTWSLHQIKRLEEIYKPCKFHEDPSTIGFTIKWSNVCRRPLGLLCYLSSGLRACFYRGIYQKSRGIFKQVTESWKSPYN